MSIRDWLLKARAAGVARLDAQVLLAHHQRCPRAWLLAHDAEELSAEVMARADADLARRAEGVPLAYLVGEREFHGLALRVTPDVLVPRPETEGLVDWALALAPNAPLARLADLGTGSGAIALAFKHRAGDFEVWASDRSAAALAVARANGQRLGLPVHWLEGEWWQPYAGQHFGLVVSNPPYVAEADHHLAALRHEPAAALAAGPDGLRDLEAIVAEAPAHLAPGGWLLLEHGSDQAVAVATLLQGRGFTDITLRRDLAGHPRVTGGRWPAA